MMNRYVRDAVEMAGDRGVIEDDFDRRGDHEEQFGLGQDRADDSAPIGAVGLARQDPLADRAHDEHQSDDRCGHDRTQ